MFCGNCGAEVESNANVCGRCGAPLNGIASNISGLENVNPEQKKKKGFVKWVMVLTLAIIIAVTGFKIVLNFTGSKGLLRKVMTAYEDYDIDELIRLSSDVYYYGEEDAVEYYFEYNIGDDLDYYESSAGHNYKISYEVNEIYKVSERRLDEILNSIETTYPDFDVKMIDKIVVADITVTAKKGGKVIPHNLQVTMSKEGKEWKLLYIE